MADDGKLCYFLAIALSGLLVVYGFYCLLQKEKPTENDVQVVQRQIRGFAYIMLAQVVLVLGVALCFGMNGGLDLIRRGVKAVKP